MRTKPHAHTFKEIDNIVLSEILSSIKRHVFEEVSQTALVLFFLKRTNIHDQTQHRPPFRFLVFANVVL